jgi:hypothetical protein
MSSHDNTDDDVMHPDVAERFGGFARVEVPDTWDRIVARSLQSENPVHSRYRRLLAAAAVTLVVVGIASIAISRSSSDSPTLRSTADTTSGSAPEPTPPLTETTTVSDTSPSAPSTTMTSVPGVEADELQAVLEELGVQMATAPADVQSLDGAVFCGSERTGLEGFLTDAINTEGRRCLLDHHAARLPAVFVTEGSTDEGDPIVTVVRTRSDGTASYRIDSTRDTFGSGTWDGFDCQRLVAVGNPDASPVAFDCDRSSEEFATPIEVAPLAFPDWFADRTAASPCGYLSQRVDDDISSGDRRALACMADAIDRGEPAELVTVHVGNDLRVARWIVTIGAGQFEVASLVVDLRDATTRWAETRCVTGELVDGRLVGEFIVDRDVVDRLDPSGTTVTDDGQILELPSPDDRQQLQPCYSPQTVVGPTVTPFESTGLRVGDTGSSGSRPLDLNELGEFDPSMAGSWAPVGLVNDEGVIGFARFDDLYFPRPPSEFGESDRTIYGDDGVTRVGEFGPDGFAVLD